MRICKLKQIIVDHFDESDFPYDQEQLEKMTTQHLLEVAQQAGIVSLVDGEHYVDQNNQLIGVKE